MNRVYPNLEQFLSGYFHQDWDIEGGNDSEVVSAYKSNESVENIQSVVMDLGKAIRICEQRDMNADQILQQLGCEYFYKNDGLSGLDWMRRVKALLEGKGPKEGNRRVGPSQVVDR